MLDLSARRYSTVEDALLDRDLAAKEQRQISFGQRKLNLAIDSRSHPGPTIGEEDLHRRRLADADDGPEAPQVSAKGREMHGGLERYQLQGLLELVGKRAPAALNHGRTP
jgi:hypothetical protein